MANQMNDRTRRAMVLALCGSALAVGGMGAGPGDVAVHDDCLIASQNALGFQRHECDIAGCGKQAAMRLRMSQGGEVGEDDPFAGVSRQEAFQATDLQSVVLDLAFDPTINNHLTGTCAYTVRVVTPGTNQFTVRLRSQFVVTGLTLNGASWPLANISAPSTTTRVVTLDRAYAADEVFTLTIGYTGEAISRGFGSIEFTSQNGLPLVATLSEPYFAYTWWPAKDGDFGQPGDMSDKFTMEMKVTAPSTLVTASNGLLQGVAALSGGRSRYHFKTNYPIATYLVAFATTPYNAYSVPWTIPGGGGATMPVDFYLWPASDTPANRANWEICLPALDLYSDLFGIYPFVNEKYGMYQFQFGGGMEHQTMTGQGVFIEYVTVHELAHQWWGDDVTCKFWNDIWLNEGFADYSEALWYEKKIGSTGLPALKSAMAARRPGANSGTVYVFDTTNANRIFQTSTSYYKGGWVLHMLRHAVGDEAFFDVIAAHRAAHTGSAATTDDFRAVAEGVVGTSLTQFFNQWVYGTGEVAYASGFDSITVNGRKYARFHVRQTQNPAHGSGGKFEMPIDVRLTQGGTSSTVVVNNTQAASQFYCVPVADTVTAMALDPDVWILASSNVSEPMPVGPPKVVQVVPDPGTALAFEDATQQVDVYFSAPVNTAQGHYTLTGPSGSVPVTLTYSAVDQRARLTTASALVPGEYTLNIAAAVTATTGGQALDGEVLVPTSPASLPSGDGIAGGVGGATVAFSVSAPACTVEYNNDGALNPDDLGDFITDYYTVPHIPGPGGYAIACPGNAPPYDEGYQTAFTPDGSGQCGEPFPDNLGDYITAYYQGC
ncbi:MAG: M1 family aminopeptidase [Phycisphaerales bacterium]